jgi:imidazoleglycerol-phosphate dehydratase/histidinol-phosphatase
MLKKYAFLDRDGTLIYEPQDDFQVDSLERLKILPGVIDGLKKLVSEGFSLVIVTNQDGLGESSFPFENFEIPQKRMLEIFKENGIEFEEVFVCPHRASDNCICRKPKTGLVDEFLKGKIYMGNSFVYGDRETDREFANNLNLKFIKAQTNGKFNLDN